MLLIYLIIGTIFLGGMAYYLFYLKPRMDPRNRAENFLNEDRVDEAIMEYKKALESSPDDFITHHRLANLYFSINEIDQAAQHLEKLLNIGKFNYEVDKQDIQKKLANVFYLRDDIESAFEIYIDVLRMYPADIESLYHVSFIALGQEEFDIAQRYLERLVKLKPDSFEVLFGAGICSYQNQKINEAGNYFKEAANLKPQSEIVNIALAFTFDRKRDYRQSMAYIQKVADSATEVQVLFIAKRYLAFLQARLDKMDEAIKLFQQVLELTQKNNIVDEELVTLYDLGFACLKGEHTDNAYEYWNELYRKDRSFKNVQQLVTQLRKEMETNLHAHDEFDVSVMDYVDEWIMHPFPSGFLWGICGLKSEKELNIKNVMVTTRVSPDSEGQSSGSGRYQGGGDLVGTLVSLDTENFRIIANRLVSKIGYKVDQILQTYREADGVDFLAIDKQTKDKTLVWVRRWSKTNVGEITLRNFAQAINDIKAKQGLFITTADLTDAARSSMRKLSKVTVIEPEEVNTLLRGLL